MKRTLLIVFILCFAFSLILLKTLLNADNNVEKKYNFYKFLF